MVYRLALLAGLACLLVGCGSSGIVVTGQVVVGGNVYKPGTNESAIVTLVEGTGKDQKLFAGSLNSDGDFQIVSANNVGIPPGKYKVGFSSLPTVPSKTAPYVDKFKGAYDPEKTKVVVEISSANRNIKVELKDAK